MTGDDEEVSQRQHEEDVELYGRRLIPTENEGIDEVMLESPQQGSTHLNLASLQDLSAPSLSITVSGITEPIFSKIFSEAKDISLEAISDDEVVVGGIQKASQLDTWLTESSSAPSGRLNIAYESLGGRNGELDEREREEKEIEFFRNVHISPAPNSEPDKPKEETNVLFAEVTRDLGVSGLIYYRNIIDRFPLVPDFLARRLAKANCQRAERLESQRRIEKETVNMKSLGVSNGNLPEPSGVDSLPKPQKSPSPFPKSQPLDSAYTPVPTLQPQTTPLRGILREPSAETSPGPETCSIDVSGKKAERDKSGNQVEGKELKTKETTSGRLSRFVEHLNDANSSPDNRKRPNFVPYKGATEEILKFMKGHKLSQEDTKNLPDGFNGVPDSIETVDLDKNTQSNGVPPLISPESPPPGKRRKLSGLFSPPVKKCERCRRLSFRCSMEKPKCARCLKSGRSCTYENLLKEKSEKSALKSNRPASARRRGSSISSDVNDSLHGTQAHDPYEQDPLFTMAPGSHSSNESHRSMELNLLLTLPHPLVEFPKTEWKEPLSFNCDICGDSVVVGKRREWK